jgi:KH domain-containing protein
MKNIVVDKLPRIIKAKKKLENSLNIKITNRGKEVQIKGTPEQEYIAEKVVEALDFGFPVSSALSIKEQDNVFEVISIKNYTTRQDLERIRARIIGTKGKTLKTLSQLTNCDFEIKGNEIGIIGSPELMQNAQNSIISLIKGTKQSNIYSYLEKHRPEPILDLGLKEPKKKK